MGNRKRHWKAMDYWRNEVGMGEAVSITAAGKGEWQRRDSLKKPEEYTDRLYHQQAIGEAAQ